MKLKILLKESNILKEEKCVICEKMIKSGEKIGSWNDNPVHKECLMKHFKNVYGKWVRRREIKRSNER